MLSNLVGDKIQKLLVTPSKNLPPLTTIKKDLKAPTKYPGRLCGTSKTAAYGSEGLTKTS